MDDKEFTQLDVASSAGTGAFYRYDQQGGITLVATNTGLQSAGKPWTQIVMVLPETHSVGVSFIGFLFYDGAGTGSFYDYDGQGGIAPIRTHTDWPSGIRIVHY